MQKRYIIATIATMMAISENVNAQDLKSAYFTQDYKFRHEMNAAYGNDQNYIALPAMGNINVSTQGNFGNQDVVFNNPRYPLNSDKKLTSFMNPYISAAEALDGFSTGNNRLNVDMKIAILSAGFKGFGGYNTVELNARTRVGASLPYELFEFAKNTGNKTYNIGDINVGAQAFAELAFGHSRDINEKLRVGAKMKLLFGLGRADVKIKDMKADLADNDKWTMQGDVQANVSVEGFKFKSKTKNYEHRTGSYEYIDDVDVDGYGLSGFGLAFDLGAIYKIDEDWTVSAALNDLGFISWSSNATAINRDKTFVFDGFHDVSATSGSGNRADDQLDEYGDQLRDFANLSENGDKGGRTTGIGATMTFGVNYVLPVYRKVDFGLLSTTRIDGPYSWTEGRLSANYSPLKWLNGGVNFAVNSFTTSMGWVLNVHPKGYNFYIGMDHILGKMSHEAIPLSSNANVSLGMSVTF